MNIVKLILLMLTNNLNKYSLKSTQYIEDLTGTGFLALRDLPQIISKFSNGGRRVLDFGCGAGRSTRFLKKIGYMADGIDINKSMLDMAKKTEPTAPYFLIKNFYDLQAFSNYDIVFNNFVLFEFGDKDLLIKNLSALYKSLKPNGILISIVNSEFLFEKKWLSVINDFVENKNLKSGAIAKIQLPEQGNIEIYDYYWTEFDYINFFKEAGFSLLHIHKPLGKTTDPYHWKDETEFPPYSMYICKK